MRQEAYSFLLAFSSCQHGPNEIHPPSSSSELQHFVLEHSKKLSHHTLSEVSAQVLSSQRPGHPPCRNLFSCSRFLKLQHFPYVHPTLGSTASCSNYLSVSLRTLFLNFLVYLHQFSHFFILNSFCSTYFCLHVGKIGK